MKKYKKDGVVENSSSQKATRIITKNIDVQMVTYHS